MNRSSNQSLSAPFRHTLHIGWIYALSALIFFSTVVFALDPRKAITQYVHDVWTVEDGLPQNSILAITQTRDGYLWLGTWHGLVRFDGVRFTVFDRQNTREIKSNYIYAFCEDRQGNLWIGTWGGLLRFRDGKFTSYTTLDGLSSDNIKAIHEDRQGNLWIGAWGGGLNRFSDGILTVFTTKEGLSHDWTHSVHEDRAGNIWVGSYGGGVSRFKDGRFTSYTLKDGLPGNIVNVIYEDREGTLWLNTVDGGLCRFRDRRFTRFGMKDGLPYDQATTIHQDRAGNLWFGSHGGRLSLLKNGKVTVYGAENGVPWIWLIYEDQKRNLWVATEDKLMLFRDGKFSDFPTRYAPFRVTSIHEDRDGSLWMATRGDGLIRIKDGESIAYTTREGLPDNALTAVLEDGRGNLWLGSFRGIFSLSRSELDDFARGNISTITPVTYGKADGMKSVECNSQQPSGWKSKDGRLWFPTVKGLIVVDPDNTRINTLAPPVSIEQFIFQNRPVDLGQRAELPPGRRELEFHYTALSLLDPKKVRFKYRLEGYDEDWVEAGARRVAYYTSLSPGSYRFRVIACNNDGVWNETGAAFEFYLQAHFYETAWFYASCALLIAVLLVMAVIGLYHQRIKRERMKQDAYSRQLIAAQERDRKRIAGDLHDGAGQLVNLISHHALDGLGEMDNHDLIAERFAKIAALAGETIEDMRTAAYNLRPPELDRLDLTRALEALVERSGASSKIEFNCAVEQIDSAFENDGKTHLYRIIQESLNNIVRHSQATEASLVVKRETKAVKIEICDNGRGFDVDLNGNRPGLGLSGIMERARLIGGKAEIRSAPGQGAKVTVIITLPEIKP